MVDSSNNYIIEQPVEGLSGPLSGANYAGRAPKKPPNLGLSTQQLQMQQDFYANNISQRSGVNPRYPWLPPSNIPSAQAKTSDPRENTEGGRIKKKRIRESFLEIIKSGKIDMFKEARKQRKLKEDIIADIGSKDAMRESGKKKKKKIAEALAMGERDPTQRRVRAGQDNTPDTGVGVKGSQEIPTRDLNNESGKKKKIKEENLIELSSDKLYAYKRGVIDKDQIDQRAAGMGLATAKIHGFAVDPSGGAGPRVKVPATDKESGKKKRIKEAYIWRTQKDEKVRDLHRSLEGKKFDEQEPPVSGTDGFRGNPGEPANCRCYAEPVKEDIIEKTIKHLNKEGANSCLFKQIIL